MKTISYLFGQIFERIYSYKPCQTKTSNLFVLSQKKKKKKKLTTILKDLKNGFNRNIPNTIN